MKYWYHIYYFPVIGMWGNLSSGLKEHSTPWSFQTILGLSQAEMIHARVAGFHSDCCAAGAPQRKKGATLQISSPVGKHHLI